MAIDWPHEGVRAAADLNEMVPPSGAVRVLQYSHLNSVAISMT